MDQRIFTALVLLASLLTGCESIPSLPPAEPVTILDAQRGDDPALEVGMVKLFKSWDELESMGAVSLAELTVDFAQADVVLFALGVQPTGGYWADITGVQKVGEVLYVQCTVNAPGEDQMVTQAITHPYCVATITKTTATTVLSDPEEVRGKPMPE